MIAAEAVAVAAVAVAAAVEAAVALEEGATAISGLDLRSCAGDPDPLKDLGRFG